ncbi:MAG: carbohydrate kinase family protein [Candidatus Pacebacteria bacterium]|nr:carbohydrate kinase family protein [Candidatus Paceibacterota bacterium]MBP9058232.1 carbohydrate kinase family protein [Candidatus Paceibacterota bacterium]MBP9770202.1 carbohydrate kinase family protein [Candidatus Paceibacterota bacterium]
MEKELDFVAVGDVVTEPFIRLKDAATHCKVDQSACELCVRFGDKVPYESAEVLRAVGNSANAAVCASRLGLKSALISDIGDDEIGKGNIEELKLNNVITDYIHTHLGLPSNYHYVLWYDVERTILVRHTEFPYQFPLDLPKTKWLYLSSLASNSEQYHKQIMLFLERNPETKLAFQPGTFQMKLGKEKLADLYKRTEFLFCNVEEAQRILGEEEKNLKILLRKMRELGPKNVVITDGIKGAYTYDGQNYLFMPVYPHTPYERTGAGDSFSSTITACLAKGKTLEESLMWAPINSMSVVQYVGAQKGLLTEDKINEFLQKAPEDYKPTTLI